MKLLRYGPVGQELPGLLDAQGNLRALSPAIGDITPDVLSPQGLAVLAALDPSRLPLVPGKPRLGVPLTGITHIHAVGLNYREHAHEAGVPVPEEPIVFNKALSCLSGPNDDIVIPTGSLSVDWEVELGFVIGTEAYQVKEADALKHIAGYLTVNDVSERDYQLKRGGQFVKGKSPPTFGPLGPYLVTADEVPDPQKLGLRLEVNGEIRQNGNTADMIFPVAWLVAHISGFYRLMPGDVVITGTPAGVGLGHKPPKYLNPGDIVVAEVEGLGRQTQTVRHA